MTIIIIIIIIIKTTTTALFDVLETRKPIPYTVCAMLFTVTTNEDRRDEQYYHINIIRWAQRVSKKNYKTFVSTKIDSKIYTHGVGDELNHYDWFIWFSVDGYLDVWRRRRVHRVSVLRYVDGGVCADSAATDNTSDEVLQRSAHFQATARRRSIRTVRRRAMVALA